MKKRELKTKEMIELTTEKMRDDDRIAKTTIDDDRSVKTERDVKC
jgi:hypothetical protein